MTDVTPSSDPQLPPDWGRAMSEAAQGLLARVTFGDPHLDAKLFVYLLPHGTGSCRAEEGAGGLQQYAKSCLLSLDHGFRRSPTWSFFQLDRMIKNDLFFRERGRKLQREGAAVAANPSGADGAATGI